MNKQRKKELLALLGKLVVQGDEMSNICFNLAQSDKFPEYKKTFKDCQRNWDSIRNLALPELKTALQ